MASQNSIYSNKKKLEIKPQYFVKEARNHPNGFTVYKVVCRVADPKSFDCFKESVIWKRYSDFKELHKHLVLLHRKLYLNGKAPGFAKPKLFGRFEESVVNERKQSAEDVLNFATEHPPLYKSAVFREFFQGLQPVDSTVEIRYLKQAPLKPEKDNKHTAIEPEDPDSSVNHSSALSEGDLQFFDPYLSTKEFIASTSANQDEDWIEQIKKSFSPPSRDPVVESRTKEDEDDLAQLEDLRVTLTQSDLEKHYSQENTKKLDLLDNNNSANNADLDAGTASCISENEEGPFRGNMDITGVHLDINAREKHRKSSKASAYLEAVIRRNRLRSENEESVERSNVAGVEKTVSADLARKSEIFNEPQPSKSPPKMNNGVLLPQEKKSSGMISRSSLLDLPKMLRDDNSDDESKGAYLAQAAQQISFARTAENKFSYEEAFGHYKAAINTLLQGVQDDTNEARVQAVRRKTANYLKRAEDIHSTYLKTTLNTNDLWKINDQRAPSPHSVINPLDFKKTRTDTPSPTPAIASPRHNSKDLASYKVLGTIGKVMLVMDTRSNETYVLKILLKSCQNRQRKGVIPTNVPFMVRLHRYYSTDHAVCLLIEHATGGRLWDQLASYFELSKTSGNLPTVEKVQGKQVLKGGMSSTPKKHIMPEMEQQNRVEDAGEMPREEEDCAPSFLDLCLEYKTVEKSDVDGDDDAEASANQECSKKLADPPKNFTAVSQHGSISEAIEDMNILSGDVVKSELNDFKEAAPEQLFSEMGTSLGQPIKRSWSYLSWDEGVGQAGVVAGGISPGPDVENAPDRADGSPTDSDERLNFKTVSSQGDIRLFTIDQDDDSEQVAANKRIEDDLEDSIYDNRSNDGSDAESSEELPGEEFAHELLSEQDMSAVSLLEENMEKTLQARLLDTPRSAVAIPSGSPVLARVADTSRGSPCLSINSSFEEDNVTSEKNGDGRTVQSALPAVTRVVDENGVSSVDAVSLFRTHSRTRSTTSICETKSSNCAAESIAEDWREMDKNRADDNLQEDIEENKIHSIFVGMDVAKERSLSYRIPESTIRNWSAEIVVAVGTLHSIAILCRDLNPNNILLSADGHIRLSYFGKWRQVERKPCDKLAVKCMYAAPEMSKVSEKKTEACDWWSVGAILYELMTGKPLYLAHPSGISSHTILWLPDNLSPEAKSLLSGLLQYHPTQRLGYGVKGLDDLMDHQFFQGIEWDLLIENYVTS